MIQHTSFFRLFKLDDEVVAVYYWKSDEYEPGTSRKGIYVVIGFIVEKPDELDINELIEYSCMFFSTAEKISNVSFSDAVADEFFRWIQKGETDLIQKFISEIGSINTYYSGKRKHIQWKKYYLKFKKYFRAKLVQNVYFLSNDISFMEYWSVFLQEAYNLYVSGIADITNKKFTEATISCIGEEELPDYVEHVKIKNCNGKKYLIFSLKSMQ
ncbi:MAG: hypothetical protein Q4C66_16475 [Lachnospiraceae bacterium]|nr:hypothetical protein [Lachnospiraceae bacterium]